MSSEAEYGAPPFVVRKEMVKKWSGDRVGSSMWPPPKSVCATIATPEVTTSVQKESSSGAGAPLPFGHSCNCRPRTPGSVATRRSSSMESWRVAAGSSPTPMRRAGSTAVYSCESQSL